MISRKNKEITKNEQLIKENKDLLDKLYDARDEFKLLINEKDKELEIYKIKIERYKKRVRDSKVKNEKLIKDNLFLNKEFDLSQKKYDESLAELYSYKSQKEFFEELYNDCANKLIEKDLTVWNWVKSWFKKSHPYEYELNREITQKEIDDFIQEEKKSKENNPEFIWVGEPIIHPAPRPGEFIPIPEGGIKIPTKNKRKKTEKQIAEEEYNKFYEIYGNADPTIHYPYPTRKIYDALHNENIKGKKKTQNRKSKAIIKSEPL